MCGIFAVISRTPDPHFNASEVILSGLKKLEYRGYDSWGIAVSVGNKISLSKHVGKISQAHPQLPLAVTGLGHTRWATHGGVTAANAHPFVDCQGNFALVHNGIIDNYQEIKKLLRSPHQFSSQTDSEILLHLIEEYAQVIPFTHAVRKAFKITRGLNAILVLFDNQLVAAKTGSPLVVGLTDTKVYVASDVWSILDYTRRVVFLEDGQMVSISTGKLKFSSIQTRCPFVPQIKTIAWQQPSLTRNKYPYFMIKEIVEQPEIIIRLIEEKKDAVARLADLIKDAPEVFLVACGTASFASLAAQYFFAQLAQIRVLPVLGSEFISLSRLIKPKSLVLALSQSGETIDTIQAIQQAKAKHAMTACLVNILGSTLYRHSDFRLTLDCGPEKAVASTKAFIAKITLLLLTAGRLSPEPRDTINELYRAASVVKQILGSPTRRKIRRLARDIKNRPTLFVVGRGPSYPAALEIALKIKEISYLHAEGLAGGELKHGPLALVEPQTPCLVIAPRDATYHDTLSAAMEMKARGGFIIGITSQPHEVFDVSFTFPDCGLAAIIPSVVIGQLLAYELALARGLDPDKPRNLAKSVTVK